MPTPPIRTVIGPLYDANGNLLNGYRIVFTRVGDPVNAAGAAVFPVFGATQPREEVTTDATTADFEVALVPGEYQVALAGPTGVRTVTLFVPDGEGAVTFANLLNAQPTYTPTLVEQAEDARDLSIQYASAAGAASGVLVRDSAAALRADTALTYTAGQPGTVTPGLVVTTKDGFGFMVLSSGGVAETTNANGVKFAVATGRNCPLPFGAVGDGITNDKAAIDLLNVAGSTVDLRGRDYAYTGNFVPLALFTNGRIISTTEGIYDYRQIEIVGHRTITVGSAGEMKTLAAWIKWVNTIRVAGSMEVTVTGSHSVANLTLSCPDSQRIVIRGPSTPVMPTELDMSGDRATDEALIVARFGAVIDVGGSGDNTSGGLRIPNGLNFLENLVVVGNTRYMINKGFQESHANSVPAHRLGLANVAVVGGVWAIVAVQTDVRIRAGTSVFFAYQNTGDQPGGPVALFGGVSRLEGPYVVYSAGQPSKYGLHAAEGAIVIANSQIRITGPFLHGVHAVYARVECDGLVTKGVSQPLTAQPGGAFIRCRNPVFADGNTANTVLLSGAGQGGFGNNDSARSMIHCGAGSTISGTGGTATNMVGDYLFHVIGGRLSWGTGAMAANDCRFGLAAARFYGCDAGSYLAITVTNGKAGSLNQLLAAGVSQVRLGTNSGLTLSPALGSPSNGNAFHNVG